MTDRHPGGQFFQGLRMPVDFVPSPVFQLVPRFSGGVNSGVSEGVIAVKNQGLFGSCSAFSVTQAVELQLVQTAGGLHCGFYAHCTRETARSSHSWRYLVFHCGGQCCQESLSLRVLPGVPCYPVVGISVGADFVYVPLVSGSHLFGVCLV